MEEMTYAEAARELEGILGELEGDRLDVDQVAGKVARAGELIRICRSKVSDAQAAVKRISVDGEQR